MGRRQAREAALQALYQVDVGGADPEKALADTAELNQMVPEDLGFSKELVLGAVGRLEEIDRLIAALSRDWNIDRLARVDHNIMRLAVYEIMFRDDIPFGVTVNEAVELAKTFGGKDSGRFINGILAQVAERSDPAGVAVRPDPAGAAGTAGAGEVMMEGRTD